MMSSRIRLIFFAILFLNINVMPIIAQHNSFQINDKLYEYYRKCDRVLEKNQVLAMCDTLYAMAGAMHEPKAQCIAIYMKGNHYFLIKDYSNLLKLKNDLFDFAHKNNYLQYYFGLWNLYINSYIGKHDYINAVAELKRYQEAAYKYNNIYGIGYAYCKLGDIYYNMSQLDMCISEYLNCLNYFKTSKYMKETSHVYNSLGLAYYSINNFDKAAEYYKMTLQRELHDYYGNAYIMLAIINVVKKPSDLKSAEFYLNKYKEWRKEHSRVDGSKYYLYLMYIRYNTAIGNYNKALAYCDSLGDPVQITQHKATVYYQMRDYKNAYDNKDANFKYFIEGSKNELQRSLAESSARFENERLRSEKNALALRNSEITLRQLQERQQYMILDKERSRLELDNTRLELNNNKLALMNQQSLLEKQRADLAKQRMDAQQQHDRASNLEIINKKNKHIATLSLLFLIMISLFVAVYLYLHKKGEKRLKKEMEISEQSRKEAEIAREEAEKADKLKSLFLQNMSHEIRTPLNAIVGFSDLLAESSGELDNETKSQSVDLIHSNTRLLTTLINDILDLSKFESGTYKIVLEKVGLNELCEQTFWSIKGHEAKGVDIQFIAPAENYTLLTDKGRTQQLLSNFLTNACKYTKEGSIVLTYEKQENNIVFSVTDTGIGIDPAFQDKVFERFEKLNSFVQGTGLGLSICKNIARLLHGEVKLDTTYQKGCRFLFIHPTQQPT